MLEQVVPARRCMSRRDVRQNRRVSDTPGTGFQPTQVAGCVLWLRSDLGITLNGSNVSGWADQSGNANDAVQSIAIRQPAYQPGAGVNGLPWIYWTPISRQSLNAPLTQAEPVDVFMVANVPNLIQTASPYLLNQSGTAGIFLHAIGGDFSVSPPSLFARDQDPGTGTPAYHPNPPVDLILEATWSAAHGTTFAVNNGTQLTANDPTFAGLAFTIGHVVNSGSFNNSWVSGIYEVIVYNNYISATDRTTVSRYLGGRYSITVP